MALREPFAGLAGGVLLEWIVKRLPRHLLHPIRRAWHRSQANAGGGEDRVADGGGDGHQGGFAGASGGEVAAVDADCLDLRQIGEARDAVAREARVEDLPVLELHRLEERAA